MMTERARKQRIAANISYGEAGDVEIGENAEIIATQERGTIIHVDHKNSHATIGLNGGGTAQLPIVCFRAIRERSKGLDTSVRGRK